MADLVRVDRERVERRIRAHLQDFPDVAGAFLFGSALDTCRPDSDIDVGLVTVRAHEDAWTALGFAEEVAGALDETDGHPFHVVVLSQRAPFLAFEAVHTGRLVYIRDEDVVTDFMEAVALRYQDEYPRYREALREVNS